MSETKLESKQEKDLLLEDVTLKLPVKLMDFLRQMDGDPIPSMEHYMVDCLRSVLEAMSGEEYVKAFGLGPVFSRVLGDKRFTKTKKLVKG